MGAPRATPDEREERGIRYAQMARRGHEHHGHGQEQQGNLEELHA